MKIFQIIAIILMLPGLSQAWYRTLYDTVETKYPNGNTKEYYTRAYFTANEKGYLPHGLYTGWYENGQMKEQGIYKWKKKNQLWVEWDSSGNRLVEAYYKDDRLSGPYLERYENSNKKVEGMYRHDRKVGLWRWYRPNRDPNHTIDMFIAKEKLYYDGILLADLSDSTYWIDSDDSTHYYNRMEDIWVFWDSSLTVFEFGRKEGDKRDSLWLIIDRDGTILEEIYYSGGQVKNRRVLPAYRKSIGNLPSER